MAIYEVPGMTLIPQDFTMSCWYASALMLVQWREDQAQASLQWLVPPDLDAECQRIRDANSGLQNPQILPMAKRVGLQAVPPSSPSVEALQGWLRCYGPLWVNGKTHIVVIAGIDTEALTVKVYDPSPVKQGRIEWRSLSSWYAFGTSPSTRDTGADVEAVFLFVPR
jgi:papain like cysteine protease AvrRpt2